MGARTVAGEAGEAVEGVAAMGTGVAAAGAEVCLAFFLLSLCTQIVVHMSSPCKTV